MPGDAAEQVELLISLYQRLFCPYTLRDVPDITLDDLLVINSIDIAY